jgi:5,10-methylene-tetrahydrofolate dehydrogenase/methenyl tetrahydrofolate cyclohydrolase
VGIASFKTEFGEDVPEAELIAKVQELNNDPAIHGTLAGGGMVMILCRV